MNVKTGRVIGSFLLCMAGWCGLPQPVVAQIAKIDTCRSDWANQGKLQNQRCRDQIDRNHAGPELVVVKSTNGQAFAISRYEISVQDFNLYCTLYRRCTPQRDSLLPMTGIDVQQVKFYAQWLSRMTGHEYRLPELTEWLAVAQDDGGIKAHNCLIFANGRQVRGGRLWAVDQGYANSLGLLNLFGNAEEWVLQNGNPVLVGGTANTPLAQCTAQYRNEKSPQAAGPMRGFRLVREIKN